MNNLVFEAVFKKLEMGLSSGINIIIGKNGIGKTFFLKKRYSKELAAGKNSVYIPVNEILTDAPGFRALYNLRHIHRSEIDYNLIVAACLPRLRKRHPLLDSALAKIQKTTGGTIVVKGNDQFYLITDREESKFDMVADGFCKLGLIWLLIANGSIEKDSVLFWDEPEANMNPLLIAKLVEIMLQLEQGGVQIILATHSYVLLKEFDLQRKKKNKLMFHAFYQENIESPVQCESAEQYLDIKNNAIHEEFDSLYDRQIDQAAG